MVVPLIFQPYAVVENSWKKLHIWRELYYWTVQSLCLREADMRKEKGAQYSRDNHKWWNFLENLIFEHPQACPFWRKILRRWLSSIVTFSKLKNLVTISFSTWFPALVSNFCSTSVHYWRAMHIFLPVLAACPLFLPAKLPNFYISFEF